MNLGAVSPEVVSSQPLSGQLMGLCRLKPWPGVVYKTSSINWLNLPLKMDNRSAYDLIELPNGIRVIHRQVTNTKIAHCAIMLDIGSRDEKNDQVGIAHFWEHMAFKGTKKRKAFHIINRLESLGGELNAYTTKEKICFYSSVLDEHLSKSVELLADITFHSTFPDHQIEKERQVILEEMAMYHDNPEDAIQDELDAVVFRGHQMGNNILGTRSSVEGLHKQKFLEFVGQNMDTSRIIFASVGNYSMQKLQREINKNLDSIPKMAVTGVRHLVNGYRPNTLSRPKKIVQSHVAIGCRGFDLYSEHKIPFFVLNSILGGNSMNSRLNLTLREKYGLVYHIESNYQAYTDTGMFSIFYATDPGNLKKSLNLVKKEIKKIQEVKLGSKQLQTAKDQIKGQLAMSEENNQNFVLMMAKSMLDHGKIKSLESVFAEIDQIKADDLRQLANELLQFDQMSVLTYESQLQ